MRYLILVISFAAICNFSADGQRILNVQKQASAHRIQMEIDNVKRDFIIHLPTSLKDERGVLPIIFMLHGTGGSGGRFYSMSGWKELGDQEGFISVFPTAIKTCIDPGDGPKTLTKWMHYGLLDKTCNGDVAADDTKFIRAIANYVVKEYRADPSRMYCAGFSNGCGFTFHNVNAELGDIFAAIGGSGNMMANVSKSPSPRPAMFFMGDSDHKFTVRNNNQKLPMDKAGMLSNALVSMHLDNLADSFSMQKTCKVVKNSKMTMLRFTKPLDSGPRELRFIMMRNVDHHWPKGLAKTQGINAPELLWNFFKQYQL